MKKMFTGDWAKLQKGLRHIQNGKATELLTQDVKELANEFYEKLVETLETHGASVGMNYGTVSESWHRTRQSGIVGYLRGGVTGTYVGGMGNQAGYHTGAYAAALRPKVLSRHLRNGIKIEVAPDRHTTHQYVTGEYGRMDETPIWELASILELQFPHWEPTIARLHLLRNYKKLVDLQSLNMLFK